jgi:SAM-dependent methyltransferase
LGEGPDYSLDLPPERVRALLALAEQHGWQAALHDHLRPVDHRLYRRAVDEYRAQWRVLLPRASGGRALELRCAWGPITLALAEAYGQVAAADPCHDMARFAQLRAASGEAGNVQALSFDPAARWPFPDAHFDLVVLHDVVEWGAAARLFGEAARVTAAGGVLFVCAANRLDVPALLQGALRWARGRAPGGAAGLGAPGGRPLSLRSYRGALARAGFSAPVAFGLLPSADEPYYLVPLANAAALRYQLDSIFDDASLQQALSQSRRHLLPAYRLARGLWRAARRLPIAPALRHVLPGYALLAYRE